MSGRICISRNKTVVSAVLFGCAFTSVAVSAFDLEALANKLQSFHIDRELYPYWTKCPSGDKRTYEDTTKSFPGGDVRNVGGRFNYIPSDAKTSWYKSSYWVSHYDFAQCNCTDFVAAGINAILDHLQIYGGRFGNSAYFDDKRVITNGNREYRKWSHAKYWRTVAELSQVGVTGSSDNFGDRSTLNGGFKGDVAYWKARSDFGHVALIYDSDANGWGAGKPCIKYAQYNDPDPNDYSESGMRTPRGKQVPKKTCRGDANWPDAFLHVWQDMAYCLAHKDEAMQARKEGRNDFCPGFHYTNQTAYLTAPGGFGGGSVNVGKPDIVIDYDIFDVANGIELKAERGAKLYPGSVIRHSTELASLYADAKKGARPNKDRIETDFYVLNPGGSAFTPFKTADQNLQSEEEQAA